MDKAGWGAPSYTIFLSVFTAIVFANISQIAARAGSHNSRGLADSAASC